MATTIEEVADPSPAGGPPTRRPGRMHRWWSSWRASLRMARRDTRRHPWRSLLVVVMVGLPVALLVAGIVFGNSSSMSQAAMLRHQMGSGEALVWAPDPFAVGGPEDPAAVAPDEEWTPPEATPVPGYEQAGSLQEQTAALEALVGGTLVPVSQSDARAVLDEDTRPPITVLNIDGREGVGDKARLTSGRWPESSDEVVVTPLGVHNGLPSSGDLTVSVAGEERTVEVVGTADALADWGMVDVVTPEPWAAETSYAHTWILLRDQPVLLEEREELAAYGIPLISRHLVLNPPPVQDLPEGEFNEADWQARQARQTAALGGAVLFMVTTLLVAPAFAVSASRQRRTLALSAANGAETAQLRRSVLAQAVVLGGLSAVAATALGCVAVWVGLQAWQAYRPWTTLGDLQVPWLAVIAVAVVALLSTFTAALLPASRLGRLDIVGVMKGQNVSPRLNRWLPVLGAVLAAVGAAGVIISVAQQRREIAIVASFVALVVGALMLVPLLLVGIARLAARLPVPLRMAARDAARHRSRAVPTVAALMAGVAILTVGAIGLASDSKQMRLEYTAGVPYGEGTLGWALDDPQGQENAENVVAEVAPELDVTVIHGVEAEDFWIGPTDEVEPVSQPFVNVVPDGCTPEDAVFTWDAHGDGSSDDEMRTAERCAVIGGPSTTVTGMGIDALPADVIVDRLGLTGARATAVREGALVVPVQLAGDATILTTVSGESTMDPETGEVDITVTERAQLPVLTVTDEQIADGVLGEGNNALVAVEKARELGWPLTAYALSLRAPDGAISPEVQERIDNALGGEQLLYVERGFERTDQLVMIGMFAIAITLLVIVTLISTALALAEQQADQATLAAVGATRGTRRKLAGAQAAVVAFVAAVTGVAIGLAPGIALTYPLTSQSWDPMTGRPVITDPIVVVPWLPLLVVIIGVPSLAALLSAAAIRRAPEMTRRTT